jgi:phosphonate degradation associated HDIG domain protein
VSVDDLFALLARSANAPYIGENVSQLEHALQCAALARRANASDALVAAALFHDIGHLCAPADAARMADLGVLDHERIGAERLRAAGLPEEVCAPVADHVRAKRWLVLRRPEYRARLSAASTGTLAHQGGPLSEAEAAAFESEPHFKDTLRLRAWDEEAKIEGWTGPSLDDYRALIEKLRAS